MPIALTTAYDPGDLDPSKSYTDVSIVDFKLGVVRQKITLYVARGYLVASVFTPGKTPEAIIEITDRPNDTPPGTEYTDLIAKLPSSGTEKIYDGAARELYTYLTTTSGIYPGTIS